MRDRPGWRGAPAGLLDLILPHRCAGCGVAGSPWCAECSREWGGVRRVHRELLAEGPPAYALGRYRGPARRAVLACKESGRRDLLPVFGRAVARGLRVLEGERALPSPVLLVPAPSRRRQIRRRGGPHMRRICARAADDLTRSGKDAAVLDCLRLDADARDSVGLEPFERVANLAGRIRVAEAVRPRHAASVVLVDDVITTGATAACASAALHLIEINVAFVLALTATAG